ncbi:MAG: biotin synthase BioB [Desulfomonilaceae bacterium]
MSTDVLYRELIDAVEEKVLAGGCILRNEAETLLDTPDEYVLRLLAVADRIRIHFKGWKFDSCSLINARSGRCAENCAFCAQSGHYATHCETYDLRSTDQILEAARSAREAGASRFCTVTSGGALSQREFDGLIESLERVHNAVQIQLDASLGFLDDQRVKRLKQAGITRYNHNLETSREYFPSICTTHTFDQRVNTVSKALSNGLSACCGGIMGMGETPSQRLDLAFTLADLGVDCVPINILDPRPGTPLEGSPPPEPMEILKTVALFRLILPKATIKIAGGREKNLGDFQGTVLRSGANGMIIRGYLTFGGRPVEDDLKMVRQAGFETE